MSERAVGALPGGQPVADRRILRFLAFGIVVVLGVSGLTARLFYLQITHVEAFAQQATTNRTVAQAIPSTRGLIYDRSGNPLVVNDPSYVIKVRPASLPDTKRDAVVAQLAVLLGMDAGDINAAIDANPGSRFDLVRVAQGVPRETADLIAEEGSRTAGRGGLGRDAAALSRRNPAVADRRLHGSDRCQAARGAQGERLSVGRPDRQELVSRHSTSRCSAARTGPRTSSATQSGARSRCSPRTSSPCPATHSS